jgi:hypothetical protein
MAQLASGTPARRPGIRTRGVSGWVALGERASTYFESSLERDWLIQLDFDPEVLELRSQPFSLQHEIGGRKRPYTPDVLATFNKEGRLETVVYEVKQHAELKADWALLRPRFKAAVKYCRSRGWRFKIVTEKHIRTPLLTNAQLLRRYRALEYPKEIADQLLFAFKALGPTTPQALLAAAYWSDTARLEALPVVWHLLAKGLIRAELSKRLTMATKIWLDT